MTKDAWEKIKKETGVNLEFDFDNFADYFDDEGKLKPEKATEYFKKANIK